MIEIVQSDVFRAWLARLTDGNARARVLGRLDRAALGNLGDWKPVGGAVAEMRIDYGPGYRLYFTRRGSRIVVVLAAGTKRSQTADIARAIEIARLFRE